MATSNKQADILVVDDTPGNLELVTEMLKAEGYKVRPVTSGAQAQQAARSVLPDLILLDILMPDMNGYEVCQHLKADDVLKDIPVLFISALDDLGDKVTAFQCGGVDYITKPFRAEEVLARVKTHLRLRQLQIEVERHNATLEETVRIRTCEITEAHARLAILDEAKSDFLSLISHELLTPISGLFELTTHILEECQTHPISASLLKLVASSQNKIRVFLDDALLLTKIQVHEDAFFQAKASLDGVLKCAVENSCDNAASVNVAFGSLPSCPYSVFGHAAPLTTALEAVLEAAVQFSRHGEVIRFFSSASATEVLLVISTTGCQVPDAILPRFFDVLALDDDLIPPGFLGLRMAVAQRIISIFGGSVAVDNIDQSGIRLTVRLKPAL